jgi:hypothetical protein
VAKIEAALERADADRLIEDSERLRRATKRLVDDLRQAESHMSTLEVAYAEDRERSATWDAYEEAARRMGELASTTDPADRKKVLDDLDIRVRLVPTRSEQDGPRDGYTLAIEGLLLMRNLSTG